MFQVFLDLGKLKVMLCILLCWTKGLHREESCILADHLEVEV